MYEEAPLRSICETCGKYVCECPPDDEADDYDEEETPFRF